MKPSIDKTIIDKTNAWPFVEAKKILKERKQYIGKKNKIILLFLSMYCFLSLRIFFASTNGHALVWSIIVLSIDDFMF